MKQRAARRTNYPFSENLRPQQMEELDTDLHQMKELESDQTSPVHCIGLVGSKIS